MIIPGVPKSCERKMRTTKARTNIERDAASIPYRLREEGWLLLMNFTPSNGKSQEITKVIGVKEITIIATIHTVSSD